MQWSCRLQSAGSFAGGAIPAFESLALDDWDHRARVRLPGRWARHEPGELQREHGVALVVGGKRIEVCDLAQPHYCASHLGLCRGYHGHRHHGNLALNCHSK
jgi:hypothetical protein